MLSVFFQACKIVQGQRYTKRLSEKQITALLKVTCQRPRDREIDILQVASNTSIWLLANIYACKILCFVILVFVFCFLMMQTVQQNAYDQDPYAKEFGIKISENLASVEARVLPAPWVE